MQSAVEHCHSALAFPPGAAGRNSPLRPAAPLNPDTRVTGSSRQSVPLFARRRPHGSGSPVASRRGAGALPAAALATGAGRVSRKEQTMIVHALSGAASLAACLRLFRHYPLAVMPDSAHGGRRSMVLMSRADGPACYFVLTQARDDLFVIRSWNQFDGVNQQIRAGEPVSGVIHQVISDGMPVPRDGALLGWLTDSQVTVMLAVHSRQPEAWDVPVPAA